MINFYELRDKIKRAVFERKNRINVIQHPVDWSWITYTLSQDGKENNPPFNEAIEILERWALSKESGNQGRHLVPLSLYIFLSSNEEIRSKIIEKIIVILNELLTKEITKFSPLNDPEQAFCIALIGDCIPRERSNKLREVILKLNNGRLLRRALYTASFIELGNESIEWPTLSGSETVEDLITLLWLFERYRGRHDQELKPVWKAFKNIKNSIILSPQDEMESAIVLSNRSIALLYEAVVKETQRPDPNILFDIYTIHERVRQVAKEHFYKKSYVTAVFETTKMFNEFIQKKTGITNKNEAELVQATMKQISNPSQLKIKFNEFLDEFSGKNEQAGLATIAEGIFKAFRNPKGHKPEDHPLVHLDAYEALDQLVCISYLMKRVEKVT